MKNVTKCLLFFLIFILPIILVFFVNPKWMARLLVLAYVIPFGIFILVFYAMNPNVEYIPKKAKLNRPKYAKQKRYVVWFIKCVMIFMAFSLLITTLLPLSKGVYSLLKGERIYVETEIVSNVIVPFPLLEFIKQEIILSEQKGLKNYNYYYSFSSRLKKDEIYKFTILPNSNLILDAEPTNTISVENN